MIGRTLRMALSRFLKKATMLALNPPNSKAAITKVGMGIKTFIFIKVNTTKAMLSPIGHQPSLVSGNKVSLIGASPVI